MKRVLYAVFAGLLAWNLGIIDFLYFRGGNFAANVTIGAVVLSIIFVLIKVLKRSQPFLQSAKKHGFFE